MHTRSQTLCVCACVRACVRACVCVCVTALIAVGCLQRFKGGKSCYEGRWLSCTFRQALDRVYLPSASSIALPPPPPPPHTHTHTTRRRLESICLLLQASRYVRLKGYFRIDSDPTDPPSAPEIGPVIPVGPVP